MTVTVDVAVVGSGCAGLFLAWYLTNEQQRTCAVLDARPFGSYSSTKNQGWVHSGALYAAKNQIDVGRECHEAYQLFEKVFPRALHDMRAFYLFDQEGLDKAVTYLGETPIRFDVLGGPGSIPESLADGAAFHAAVEVNDRPFDTNRVLTQVLTMARASGAIALPVPDPSMLTFQRMGDHWQISSKNEVVKARVLVLTAGALIPRLGEQIAPSFKDELKVQKIEVLTIGHILTESLIATPRGDGTPNVCPFLVNGRRGVTICLTGDDIDTRADRRERDFDPRDGSQERFAKALKVSMKGALALLKGQTATARIYVCQKVQRRQSGRSDDRSEIIVDLEKFSEAAPRCFAFYPGKFTASPIVARKFATRLSEELDDRDVVRVDAPPVEVDIAAQQYLSTDEFLLSSDGRDFVFSPR